MPRYIEEKKAFEVLTDYYHQRTEIQHLALIEALHRVPTADVVERKHGKWMKHNDKACWYCSECKKHNYYAYCWNSDTGEYEIQDNFCPNCGAEMVEGEEDDKR